LTGPSESAVGQLMRRKSDLNSKILQTCSTVCLSPFLPSDFHHKQTWSILLLRLRTTVQNFMKINRHTHT